MIQKLHEAVNQEAPEGDHNKQGAPETVHRALFVVHLCITSPQAMIRHRTRFS